MEDSPPPLIYVFTVRLLGIEPTIWRRIEVPENYSFWDLHVAIQDAMGWLDYHLHEFRLKDPRGGQLVRIGIPDDDDFLEPPLRADWNVPITRYFKRPGHPERRSTITWLKGHAKNYHPYRPDRFDPSAVVFMDPRERFRMMWE